MGIVAAAIESGRIRYSHHANVRMKERQIIKPEVEFVLKGGHHEARKDQFKEEHSAWDYSIRGRTLDNRNLRIVVAFEAPNVLVVTAIDLDRED